VRAKRSIRKTTRAGSVPPDGAVPEQHAAQGLARRLVLQRAQPGERVSLLGIVGDEGQPALDRRPRLVEAARVVERVGRGLGRPRAQGQGAGLVALHRGRLVQGRVGEPGRRQRVGEIQPVGRLLRVVPAHRTHQLDRLVGDVVQPPPRLLHPRRQLPRAHLLEDRGTAEALAGAFLLAVVERLLLDEGTPLGLQLLEGLAVDAGEVSSGTVDRAAASLARGWPAGNG
jgi:hypothetical protein